MQELRRAFARRDGGGFHPSHTLQGNVLSVGDCVQSPIDLTPEDIFAKKNDKVGSLCIDTYLSRMNYILAILLPPLSILLSGRPILAIVVFFIWLPAIIFSGGLTHPMFILLAWFIIFQAATAKANR